MTRAKLLALIGATLMLALSHSTTHAQPSQTSLIRAWEEVQKSDPETVAFEKTGEQRYKFKTNRFPFDGELRILKTTIDDSTGDYEYGSVVGTVEYDLVGLSDEVSKKYVRSIEAWEQNNTLYFDKESGSWMTSDKQHAKMAAKLKERTEAQQLQEQSKKTQSFWLNMAMWWGPILVLVVFWVWLLKKTGIRWQREYRNMSTAHMQRVEALLERIADTLERDGGSAHARDAREHGTQPPA